MKQKHYVILGIIVVAVAASAILFSRYTAAEISVISNSVISNDNNEDIKYPDTGSDIGYPDMGVPDPSNPPEEPPQEDAPASGGTVINGKRPFIEPIPSKPNIIVIMTDDQDDGPTWRAMNNARKLLADKGVTFVNSFVDNSLCCPSRATFFTGQYSNNNGIFFIGQKVVFNGVTYGGGYGTLHPTADNTLPVWLQNAGYNTAMIGKYLNGYGSQVSGDIVPPGWDKWFGRVDGRDGQSYGLRYYNYIVNDDGILRTYGDAPEDYITDVLTQETISFINSQASSEQPFFISLNPIAPHTEVDFSDGVRILPPKPAPRHQGAFSTERMPRPTSFNEDDVSDKPTFMRDPTNPLMSADDIAAVEELYRARLESLLSVDEAIKQIIDTLKATGKLDNTIIIYTSDNGFLHGEHRRQHGKRLVYEESIRVPLIIRGPGIRSDERLAQLVNNADLTATIIDFADATPGRILDGRSFAPILANESAPWRTALLVQGSDKLAFLPSNDTTLYGIFKAIRTKSYVYAEHEVQGGAIEKEFYDLKTNPWQKGNSYGDPRYESVVMELSDKLQSLKNCQGASCWITSPEPPHPGVEPPGMYRIDPKTPSTGTLETLEPGGVSVGYSSELIVENSKLLMETSVGKKQINILPENAILISETPNKDLVTEIKLQEENQKPVYFIQGIKRSKLLFIIPVSMKIKTKIDAENGEIISVNKPWWSFLVW